MFYKVMKDNKVIDVLDNLIYLKYQPKHKIMVLSGIDDAQAIMSSDCNSIWHVNEFYKVPVDGYETVELVEIDEFEYKQLKMLNGKNIDEILEEYTLLLISEGVI